MMRHRNRRWRMRRFVLGLVSAIVLVGLCGPAFAQVCQSVNERARIGDVGCWIVASAPVGQLGQSHVFWHLDTFATRAAAEAVKGPRGTIVESYGKVWLLTIDEKKLAPGRRRSCRRNRAASDHRRGQVLRTIHGGNVRPGNDGAVA